MLYYLMFLGDHIDSEITRLINSFTSHNIIMRRESGSERIYLMQNCLYLRGKKTPAFQAVIRSLVYLYILESSSLHNDGHFKIG